MDKNYILQLTIGLYKVTELFPEKEPLRYKIREKADDIYAAAISSNFCEKRVNCEELLNDLNVLNAFFEIAQIHNWVDSRNFIVLSQGYSSLKDEIIKKVLGDKEANETLFVQIGDTQGGQAKKPFVPRKSIGDIKQSQKTQSKRSIIVKSKGTKKKVENNGNMARRSEVQKILSQKGPMRLVQLLSNFPGLNKRTLRRDLADMVTQNTLERYDVGKLTFYKIKSV